MSKYHQGIFTPKNPEKYIGNVNKIFYRSSWERSVFYRMDQDPGIIKWASEEFGVPYLSPVDYRTHIYYPDLYLENIHGEKFVLEIKPDIQTRPPAKRSRNTKRYITEVKTFAINTSKWNAAEKFCKERGWQFKVVTEKELGIKW